jgi:hypothetical protein
VIASNSWEGRGTLKVCWEEKLVDEAFKGESLLEALKKLLVFEVRTTSWLMFGIKSFLRRFWMLC